MKSSISYRPLNSRSPFAIDRSLILPLALLATLLLGILFHCGYHFLHHLSILRPFLPSGIASLISPYCTSQLYVSSYDGFITTLNLTWGRLEIVDRTEGCGGSPSWLTKSRRGILFCVDEGLQTGEGGLSTFDIGDAGSLRLLGSMHTTFGPVSAVEYGIGDYGLAMAHYGGSALTSWNVHNPHRLASVQNLTFSLPQPGPDPSRQEAPHPHQAILDPTGEFVLVPDLGADLVRIYRIDPRDGSLEECEPLAVDPGSGPRHLAFVVQERIIRMFLVTELANTLLGYEVAYDGHSILFEKFWSSGSHGLDKEVPEGAAASEIIASPDGNYLIISSRNEATLNMPNPDPTNRTAIPSDPLLNFAIDEKTGNLTLLQEVACGGRGPRQFSLNKAGSLVAVGLQGDGTVVIRERNVETGLIGEVVAWSDVGGEVTAVIFNEEIL